MKSRKPLFFVLVILGLLGWWYWPSQPKSPSMEKPSAAAAIKPTVPMVNVTTQSTSPTPRPPSVARATAVSVPTSNLASMPPGTIIAMGAIDSKEAQATLATYQNAWNAANSKPQDLYGRVIDQFGNPVAGATVEGNVMFERGMNKTSVETHTTTTDANGLFQFTGLHGANLGTSVRKPGYEIDVHGKAYTDAIGGGQSTATNRATYTMYKLQGAEPMVHAQFMQGGIPCDGTSISFNLLTGKKDDPQKDLIGTLVRNPVNIKPGIPFDYSLTLAVPEGGLIAANDLYPYEAPNSGYQQSIVIDHPAAIKGWSPIIEQWYYFKARSGTVYGRIKVHLTADYDGPVTHLELDIYANPSGSRNLEFDPNKQVRP